MLCEKKNSIEDQSGYRLQLEEISFNQVGLKWGSYVSPNYKILSFHPGRTAIVSHFLMTDPTATCDEKGIRLKEKQFVVYRESAGSYDLPVTPTKDKPRIFFELIISEDFFNNIFTEDSRFLTRFHQHSSVMTPSYDFTAQMTPAMQGLIAEMHNSPYSGHLKGVHLEAKAIELFLTQVRQLDQQTRPSRLNPRDIEALHTVREYMETHYDQPCSIIQLAAKVGINQMKLKTGFKELFNTTIFSYLTTIRMEEAKRLLLEEKMYVNEVADKIGYQHPHHFTAAFKRKFGMLPRDLKK